MIGHRFFSANKRLLLLGFMLTLLSACEPANGSYHGTDDMTIADKALRTVFSCTRNDVIAFDDCLQSNDEYDQENLETGVGISPGSDAVTKFFSARLGDVMTETCISECLKKRILSQSIELSRQYEKNIVVENLELSKRSGGEASYTFKLDMKGEDSAAEASTITGTITLVKFEESWMVNTLTCNK